MKKVRYIPADHISYINLTTNRIYDVMSCKDGIIMLLDDDGFKDYFPMYSESDGSLEFIDVTAELRCNIIYEILL